MSVNTEAAAVQKLLSELLGRDVTVEDAAEGAALAAVATYVDDEGSLAAAAGCDLPLACGAGGALSLMPPPVVAESVAAGKMDDVLADNLSEVLNVCAVLLNGEGARHVKLDGIGFAEPWGAGAELLAGGAVRTLRVSIDGYGGGTFRIALA